MQEFQLPIRVYIEDTDAGGIVYYVNYLKYFERCRTELLRSLGYGKAAILDDGLLLVVAHATANYLSSAYLDDELIATASIQKLAKTHVVFQQEIRRGQEKLCYSEIKVACVRPTEKRYETLRNSRNNSPQFKEPHSILVVITFLFPR